MSRSLFRCCDITPVTAFYAQRVKCPSFVAFATSAGSPQDVSIESAWSDSLLWFQVSISVMLFLVIFLLAWVFLLATFYFVFGTLFGHKKVALLNPGKLPVSGFNFSDVVCMFQDTFAVILNSVMFDFSGIEILFVHIVLLFHDSRQL